MAKATSVITDKKLAEENIKGLNADLINLAKTIKKQSEDLTAIMKGDAEHDGAYWNGKQAYIWYNKAINNLNTNIDQYAMIYDALKDYADVFEGIVRNDDR